MAPMAHKSKIEIHDAKLEMSIVFGNSVPEYSNRKIQELDKLIRIWFRSIPIERFLFEQTNVNTVFDYEFKHQDGRIWNQQLDFGIDSFDPAISISANPGWQKSEIDFHEDVEEQVIEMRNALNVILIKAEAL